MFESVKDRKAREEELLKQQEALLAMRRAVAQVADSSSESQLALKGMEQSRENLDGALNQVVSMVHKIRKNETDQARDEAELRQQLRRLCQSFRQREEQQRQGMEEAGRKQQALRDCMDQGKAAKESLAELNQWARGYPEELLKMQQQAAAMEEQARSMSVLSLNAAIEAGRMGDPGRKFVMVAEEVRSSTGEYRMAAQQLGQELVQMKEAFQDVAGQLSRLTELLEKRDAGMEKAVSGLETCLSQMEPERRPSKDRKDPRQDVSDGRRLERLYKRWEQAAGTVSGQENYFEQILRQMEAAGESYMREQELLEQLKGWQDQIQDAIKERESWE